MPEKGKGKVKCTLVQAPRLSTSRTAHRGSRDIALLFLDHGTRRGRAVSVTPRERPGTHCTGGWMDPRAGMDRCGKSRPYRHPIPGRTVQLVANRYTDYATLPTQCRKRCLNSDAVNIPVFCFITQHIYVSSMIVATNVLVCFL